MKKFRVQITRQHIEQANPKQAGDAIAIALRELGFEHVEVVYGWVAIGNNPQDSIAYHNDEVLSYWVTSSYHAPERIKPISIEFCKDWGSVPFTRTWLSPLALLTPRGNLTPH